MKTELHRRSIAKAISWRITGTVDTIIISWLVTGKIGLAASIGLFELMTKTVIYYLHERAWHKVGWGFSNTIDADGAGGGI